MTSLADRFGAFRGNRRDRVVDTFFGNDKSVIGFDHEIEPGFTVGRTFVCKQKAV